MKKEKSMSKHKDILDNFSDKFPILNRLYDLYTQTNEFAEKDEDTLRKSSEITILEILELVVIASRQRKEEKIQTLRQAHRKLDILKVFSEMAKEIQAVTEKNYEEITENMESVGRMIGGWLKAVTTPKTTEA